LIFDPRETRHGDLRALQTNDICANARSREDQNAGSFEKCGLEIANHRKALPPTRLTPPERREKGAYEEAAAFVGSGSEAEVERCVRLAHNVSRNAQPRARLLKYKFHAMHDWVQTQAGF
jgi:hypothetical protein